MLAVEHPNQWHRNEFENVGGGAHVRRKAPEKNFVVPSTFWLCKYY